VKQTVSSAASASSGTPTGTVTLIPSSTGKALATYTLTAGAVNTTISTLPSGNYTVTADYGGDSTFSPSVSAPVAVRVGTSTVSLSPVALSFGNENVGSASAAKSVTLTNKGTAPLGGIVISLAGASPGDYSQTNTCASTLAAAANCSISVLFKPTATGLRTATVSIADDASGSAQTVPLSGIGVSTGTPTLTLAPAMLTFGSQNLGTASAGQTVTLTNSGTNALSIVSATFQASCTIAVAFKPTVAAARTATLVIRDNASGSPQSVALSGTGVNTGTPAVALSATSLTFASQEVGTSSAGQTITLTNSGTGALSISSVSLTGANPGDFVGANGCFGLIAASSTCKITVTFRPHATGTRTANVSIADSASGSPQTVTLSGTATAPVIAVGR
jgi:hypothetical protein